jgi:Spy/CpxP family protein refolding chaperone
MKRIHFILATLLCAAATLLCMSTTAWAQDNQNPQAEHHEHGQGMNADAQLEHMSQTLNLTDDQKTKIKPILEDSAKQMQQLRQDTSVSQEDRHTKMQQIHESTMSQIKPILTDDQQKKLDSMMQHGPGERGHGHKKGTDQSSSPQ